MSKLQSDLGFDNNIAVIARDSQKGRGLTVWTLMWAGFWTGIVLCGFVILMR